MNSNESMKLWTSLQAVIYDEANCSLVHYTEEIAQFSCRIVIEWERVLLEEMALSELNDFNDHLLLLWTFYSCASLMEARKCSQMLVLCRHLGGIQVVDHMFKTLCYLFTRSLRHGCWPSVVLRGGRNRSSWRKPPTLDRWPLPCHMPTQGIQPGLQRWQARVCPCAIQALKLICIKLVGNGQVDGHENIAILQWVRTLSIFSSVQWYICPM